MQAYPYKQSCGSLSSEVSCIVTAVKRHCCQGLQSSFCCNTHGLYCILTVPIHPQGGVPPTLPQSSMEPGAAVIGSLFHPQQQLRCGSPAVVHRQFVTGPKWEQLSSVLSPSPSHWHHQSDQSSSTTRWGAQPSAPQYEPLPGGNGGGDRQAQQHLYDTQPPPSGAYQQPNDAPSAPAMEREGSPPVVPKLNLPPHKEA